MSKGQVQNLRARCAECLYQVVDKGRSLSDALPVAQSGLANPKDKALVAEICYGVLRVLPTLDFCSAKLLDKPLKGKKRPFQFLLYVGFYQLMAMRIPAHAALSETVEGAVAMKAGGLKGMINGVLRNFQRQQEALLEQAKKVDSCRYNHPNWFIKKVKEHYPEDWPEILAANQQQAPMWLRVNRQQYTRDDYLSALLDSEIQAATYNALQSAICLEKPVDVTRLPDFAEGGCSVQDGAAQFAGQLMAVKDGEKVLDACAAPGGKTCHMLEMASSVDMTAIDCDENRLKSVEENLTRLKLSAKLIAADASDVDAWHDGELFDRILLDAPCSATGVIRRHPDIKWLRRAVDIEELAALQWRILNNLWGLLKPGGTLVYATCSVMPEENKQQMTRFLDETQDAELDSIHSTETLENPGWQLLPGQDNMDGFYYCRLVKEA